MPKLVLKKLTKVEQCMVRGPSNSDSTAQASSTSTTEDIINRVDISTLPAKNAYAYALILLDCFFTKDELRTSLMFKSARSSKDTLYQKRANHLLSLVQKRYQPKEYDMKKLISKINHKCCDSNLIKIKKNRIFWINRHAISKSQEIPGIFVSNSDNDDDSDN